MSSSLTLVPIYDLAATPGIFAATNDTGIIPLNGPRIIDNIFSGGDLKYRIAFTAVTNEAGTLTTTGRDEYGNVLTETINCPQSNTVHTTKYFSEVNEIERSVTGAPANIDSSVTGLCCSKWQKVSPAFFNFISWDINVFNTDVGGTANTCSYYIDHTLSPLGFGFEDPRNINIHEAFKTSAGSLAPATGDIVGNYDSPPNGFRLVVDTYTGVLGNENTTIGFNYIRG